MSEGKFEEKAQVKEDMQKELLKEATERDLTASQILKEKILADRQAWWQEYMADLERKGKNREGVTLWEQLDHEADKVLHAEQHAYNDWRSAMMSLLALFSLMVKAGSHSLETVVAQNEMITSARLAARAALVQVKDKILDTLRGNPRVDLPALIHDVKMTDDNKIDFGALKRSDDLQSTPTLNEGFQTLIALWLHDQGYEPGSIENTYVTADENKTLLTKEKFLELKNSPEHGLNKFLEETVDLEFREGPRLS